MCARRVLRSGPGFAAVKGPTISKPADPDQPTFLDDPMPRRVEPCLAKLADRPPEGDNWSFEVKWDGYRIAVHLEPGAKLRILTSSGLDWTNRFPAIAEAASQLMIDSAIIDGEAVVLDARGASDFRALQRALGGRGGNRSAEPALMFAFDLLYLNGVDLRPRPLSERRALLADVVERAAPGIMLSEEVVADGNAFFSLACRMGLEGVIAKRRDAPYRSGRGGDWLKIKCIQSEIFFIIGYEPSSAALGGIRRVLLAARNGDELAYVGGVASGLTLRTAHALRQHLETLTADKPPLPLKRKGARWVRPVLTAEIEFHGWTDDRKLRQPSYRGLRDEADARRVFRLNES